MKILYCDISIISQCEIVSKLFNVPRERLRYASYSLILFDFCKFWLIKVWKKYFFSKVFNFILGHFSLFLGLFWANFLAVDSGWYGKIFVWELFGISDLGPIFYVLDPIDEISLIFQDITTNVTMWIIF